MQSQQSQTVGITIHTELESKATKHRQLSKSSRTKNKIKTYTRHKPTKTHTHTHTHTHARTRARARARVRACVCVCVCVCVLVGLWRVYVLILFFVLELLDSCRCFVALLSSSVWIVMPTVCDCCDCMVLGKIKWNEIKVNATGYELIYPAALSHYSVFRSRGKLQYTFKLK